MSPSLVSTIVRFSFHRHNHRHCLVFFLISSPEILISLKRFLVPIFKHIAESTHLRYYRINPKSSILPRRKSLQALPGPLFLNESLDILSVYSYHLVSPGVNKCVIIGACGILFRRHRRKRRRPRHHHRTHHFLVNHIELIFAHGLSLFLSLSFSPSFLLLPLFVLLYLVYLRELRGRFFKSQNNSKISSF